MSGNFITSYTATNNYTYHIRYRGKLLVLANDSDTNWWTDNRSGLLIHGALVNAIPYVKTPKVAEWTMQYDRLEKEFRVTLGREKFSGDKQQFTTPQDILQSMDIYY